MAIKDDTQSYIGADLSGNSFLAILTDGVGEVLDRYEAEMDADGGTGQLLNHLEESRRRWATAGGLGVALPGFLNAPPAVLEPNTSNLRREIELRLGTTAVLEPFARAAAFAERARGAGQGCQNMLYVSIGSHVESALIINGELWHGKSGYAGEFGHMTIDPEGIECVCGNTGCLETVASAPNIVRRTHDRLYRDNTSSLSKLAFNKNFTAADIAREARNGDDFAMLMINRTGKFIATAVAAVINLLSLERIVLGGEVLGAEELILDPILQEASRRSLRPSFDATTIVAASLGSDAAAIGAALLARKFSSH
jgi:glucokinase